MWRITPKAHRIRLENAFSRLNKLARDGGNADMALNGGSLQLNEMNCQVIWVDTHTQGNMDRTCTARNYKSLS